jgi:hypothetical protein
LGFWKPLNIENLFWGPGQATGTGEKPLPASAWSPDPDSYFE